jgi:hypothetical protein
MIVPKSQTDKNKGPKAIDNECVFHLEFKEMLRVMTVAFVSHTIDANLSHIGHIYPSFSSLMKILQMSTLNGKYQRIKFLHDIVYVIEEKLKLFLVF